MDTARKMRNKAAMYLLRNTPNNNAKTLESKQKFRNAMKVYLYGGRSYKNGKKLGTLVSNGLFIYSSIPRKGSSSKNSNFKKGLKNGAKASSLYWMPGIVTRDVLRGINIGSLFKEKINSSPNKRNNKNKTGKF